MTFVYFLKGGRLATQSRTGRPSLSTPEWQCHIPGFHHISHFLAKQVGKLSISRGEPYTFSFTSISNNLMLIILLKKEAQFKL